jgi:hypothetical protein
MIIKALLMFDRYAVIITKHRPRSGQTSVTLMAIRDRDCMNIAAATTQWLNLKNVTNHLMFNHCVVGRPACP